MLTDKQSKFIEAYKLLNDPTKAAISAGYSVKTASIEANRLLKSAKILSELDLWRKEKQKQFTKEDFVDLALDSFRKLEITEPNSPRFLDLAGKGAGHIGASNDKGTQTINNLTQINISGTESGAQLWEMTRKLLGND